LRSSAVVLSVDAFRKITRAVYSNVGSHIELVAPGGDFARAGATGGILQQTLDLDLTETFAGPVSRYTAPRFDVFAYFYFEGSSMATAHVSGLAALLVSQGITDPAAVKASIESTAMDLGTAGRDDTTGHGLMQPAEALKGLGLGQ